MATKHLTDGLFDFSSADTVSADSDVSYASSADTDSISIASPDFMASYDAAAKSAALTGTIGGTSTSMTLYEIVPGATSTIDVVDLNQDGIGDCFLISSIGELAINDPSLISNDIVQNANGTQTVTLYESPRGGQPTNGESIYKKVTFTVTDSFAGNSVNSSAGQATLNGVKEIWPQVLENAVAQLDGGYNVLANGGDPAVAMEELTGQAANDYYASGFTASTLKQLTGNGYLVTLDTATSNSTYGTYGDHAYMFDGVQTVGGVAYVKALNPWGIDQPSLIPVSQLSNVFQAVTVGRA